ncbi:MAG TPA: cache domain-containing protein [Syntrophobacteria bacterium]|nr:cache domain-containing protein [Syntrophobacteria bacterium]
MMVVRCENCGQKYRIDESLIPGGTIRSRCKQCQSVIVVAKPKTSPTAALNSRVELEATLAAEDLRARSSPTPGVPPPPAQDVPAESRLEGKSVESTEPPKTEGKPRGRGPGLTAKVVALMLVISLVPLALFWAVQFKQMNDRLRADIENLMAATGKGMAGQVDEWIDKNVRVLQAAAQLPDVVSMDQRRQEPILKAIQQAYPWMYLVFTINGSGMNVARSDREALKDYSDRQYYKDVVSGKDVSWETLIGKTSNLPALILAVPIKSDGKVIGVLANAMTVQDISQKVATWRQGTSGFAFLVDEKGKVIAHHVEEYYLKQRNLGEHPLVAAFMGGRNGSLAFVGDNGTPCVGYVCGTKYRWALAVQQDEGEALNTLWRMQKFAYSLLVVTVAIVLVLAWILARSLVRPIKELTNAADRMSLGDLNVEIKTSARDEIGQLAEAIGRMQDSLRLSIERLRRRK